MRSLRLAVRLSEPSLKGLPRGTSDPYLTPIPTKRHNCKKSRFSSRYTRNVTLRNVT